MTHRRCLLIAACLAALLFAPPRSAAQPVQPDARREAFIDSLVAQMTLEEKLGQLAQYRGRWGDTGPRVEEGGEAEVRAGKVGSFLSIYGADYTRDLQRVAVEESRTGIPLLFAHDVIHGFRTIFPVPLAEAASWDTAAVRRAARHAATEASGFGIHWTYAPMVDIARDPRWGRIVEGAGEDPLLGAAMAAARVRGFQGDDLAADSTLLATAKHFVAYGAAEGGRDYNVADLSERTLHEIYLPPFKGAVDAGVATVMAAFNEIAGVPMHAHEALIDGVLREDWGWNGLVVSDYTGVLELMPHGIAATRAEAGVRALEAGVDIDMVSSIYVEDLPVAVREGRLDEAEVDQAVHRVLRLKWDIGLFDDPYRYSDAARETARTLTPEARAAARDMARRSFVLLKNDGTLPLSKTVQRLAVIGPLAEDGQSTIGNWAAAGRADEATTVLAGLRAALPNAAVTYVPGVEDVRSTDSTGFAEAVAAARAADAVVLVVGETHDMSAEAHNRTSLDLPGAQRALARAVLAAGKPTAVVLMNGRPLSIPWLAEHAPAILEAWFPGTEGGHAVADVLFGDHSPSGKLPVTFPRTVGQVPLYYNYKNTGRPYAETSRFNMRYLDAPLTPLYAFGHGLSYTTFAYSPPRLSADEIGVRSPLDVSVDVTNTGSRAGVEVVQLYLRDDVASVTRPVKELRGFRRIELAPGETQRVTFTLTPDDLAFYDLSMERVVEPGRFTVFVGTSSDNVQEAHFEVVE